MKLLRDQVLMGVMVEIESYRLAKGRFQTRPDISDRLRIAHEYVWPESVE